MADHNLVTINAVGDVVAFFKRPESAFEHVGLRLRDADIVFGQNERHYSDKEGLRPLGGFTELTSRENAKSLTLGGFDVMSFASNHCMDLGPDAMIETVELLRRLGIAVVGVGRSIEEARRPAIIERKGTRIALTPVAINPRAQPEIVDPSGKAFDEYVSYLGEITEGEGLSTEFRIHDGQLEVVLG